MANLLPGNPVLPEASAISAASSSTRLRSAPPDRFQGKPSRYSIGLFHVHVAEEKEWG